MKNYQMIRSKVQEKRCLNGGKALYCNCGCQIPHETDPDIDLTDVVVIRKSDEGYADYVLSRNGEECGNINTQYNAIFLDGVEFLGVERNYIQKLINMCHDIADNGKVDHDQTGDTPEETASFEVIAEEINLAEQDARHKSHPGYCTKCHGYCYGDCESN
jgi:hypothetical protein